VVVANFNSGHDLVFDDGTTLAACESDRVNGLKCVPREVEVPNPKGWVDIDLAFNVTTEIIHELGMLQEDDEVDIILVPLMLMRAIAAWKVSYAAAWVEDEAIGTPRDFTKMRTQRKTTNGRATKDNPNGGHPPIFHNRFCIS
jgi:hypothetical protein